MEPSPQLALSYRIVLAWVGSFSGAFAGACAIALSGLVQGAVPPVLSVALLSPLSLLVSGVTAVWVAALHAGQTLPRLGELLCSKARRAQVILSGPVAILVWWGVAHLAVRLLREFDERALDGGALLATSTLGFFISGAWLVLRAGELWSRRLPVPSIGVSLALGVLIPIILFGSSILVGSTSGTGGALALFGVFKREELSLTPAIHLGLLVGSAYLGALVTCQGRYPKTGRFAALGSFISIVVALVLGAKADYRDALKVERARSVAAVSLRLFQTAFDSDGDGFSRHFGGGDCDDNNASVSPSSKEIPNNGIDDNCSGSDLKLAAPDKDEPREQVVQAATLPESPNVLLLTIDTLRWDLGYARKDNNGKLSPHLDKLAKRSTVYESAYALASYTSKSLGPMMIGRYPSETPRSFEHFDRFGSQVPFLQERFQEKDIRTVSVQGYWYFFFKSYGFERGWHELDSSAAPKVVSIEGDRNSNGDELADQAIAQLDKLSEGKNQFFAWVHWVDPHAEYVAHEAHDYGSSSRQRYDGEVSFVDAQVGRVLQALDDKGLSDSTIVVVTSDHGEAFGEHGMIRHGFEVWEELVRVPLIVHVPGAPGRVVKPRRSLIDIAPTLLEVFDIKVEETESDFIRGTSLLRDALAPEGQELNSRPVLVDMPEGPHNRERRAFYLDDMKLITSGGRPIGLYDLAKDPGEKADLSEDSDKLAPVRAAFEAHLAGLKEVRATR